MSDLPGLNVPPVKPVPFRRNYIRQAVCELRFPTLLEMEAKPPTTLQGRLRKEYPLYQRIHSVNVGPGATETTDRHLFKSKDKAWTVAFNPSSISLETEAYVDFDPFAGRLRRMIESAADLIDSDFFTRVGLRYINAIPTGSKRAELGEWINPDLVTPLLSGAYGVVMQYSNEVRGTCVGGMYTFRHGFQPPDPGTTLEYVLDFDFYQESVAADEVRDLVKSFNEQCVSFFHWAVGPKTLQTLNE